MANKPVSQKRTDPEMEALKSAYEDGQRSKEVEVEELKARLGAAPLIFEMAGRVKAAAFSESQTRLMKILYLKRVKDDKEYRQAYGMTWEQFCEAVGEDRRRVDEQLVDLKPFKADFLAKFVSAFGVEISKIKYLGEAFSAESASFKGDSIVYAGEVIPLTPEHRDDIQALLEKLEESYQAQIEEQKAILRTKDKLIKAKEDVIHKQEKSLNKFEKDAEAKGLTLEEDAFLQKMENMKTHFDGFYMLNVDPARVEEMNTGNGANPTSRMIAAYIATLQYMKMQINAAFDTAVDAFGDPEMLPEEAWHPGAAARVKPLKVAR